MRHDKRDDDGKYRERFPAEERCERAKNLTQTHEGRFTHERDAAPRRMPVEVTVPFSVPRFKDYKANRDAYRPKVTK